MVISTNNKFPFEFSDSQAGYSLIKKIYQTNDNPAREFTGAAITTGKSDVCIPLDTNTFGRITDQIQQYFYLGSEQHFSKNIHLIPYKVVDELPASQTKFILVEDTCGVWCKFINWLKGFFK